MFRFLSRSSQSELTTWEERCSIAMPLDGILMELPLQQAQNARIFLWLCRILAQRSLLDIQTVTSVLASASGATPEWVLRSVKGQ